MERFFDIHYLLGALRRRWLLILAPIVVGAPLALLVAYVLPPVYESTARILVESQQIPSDLARSTVTSAAEERINLIQQRLTTRDNLLDIASRFEVFPGREALSSAEIVGRMREAIVIRPVSFGARSRRDTTVNAVDISFRAYRASVASQVANELLTQLLEQNVQERNAQAGETLEFFGAQVDRLAADLAAMEARILQFKAENENALPDSLEFRRNELAGIQREAFVRESRRLALEERRRGLEEAIELGRSLTGGGPSSPYEQELARLRAALAQQSAIFSETHPSIRSLNARIAALEAAGVTLTDASDAEAPVSGQATEALREIERIEAELVLLEDQREVDEARIVQLEESIARTPNVEIQLGVLQRDYGALRAQYDQAVLKRAEAQTGERLEVNQQAERLEVIEQPQSPDEPISPNRVLIAGAGGVLSVGLGFGLALLAELLNPALRSARDLERELELRPIVSIPYIRTAGEGRRRRWLMRAALLLILVAAPAALFVIDQYVLPLPLLYERFVDATGLGEIVRLVQMRFGG